MNAILEQTTVHATRSIPRREYAGLIRGLQMLRANLESTGS